MAVGDRIVQTGEMPEHGEEALLRKTMVDGELVAPFPNLIEIQKHCLEQIHTLPDGVLRFDSPDPYPVTYSDQLVELKKKVFSQE
jgi:hypothetical protein